MQIAADTLTEWSHTWCVATIHFRLYCQMKKALIIHIGSTPLKRCSSVVRAFAHGVMGRRVDLSWSGPTELSLVPASAPRLV